MLFPTRYSTGTDIRTPLFVTREPVSYTPSYAPGLRCSYHPAISPSSVNVKVKNIKFQCVIAPGSHFFSRGYMTTRGEYGYTSIKRRSTASNREWGGVRGSKRGVLYLYGYSSCGTVPIQLSLHQSWPLGFTYRDGRVLHLYRWVNL